MTPSSPSYWMFVLATKESAEWVLENGVMGFKSGVPVSGISPGDGVVLYLTRGVRRNPTRDRARIAAIGVTTAALSAQPRMIAGTRYERTCGFRFDQKFGLTAGPEFVPLVERLSFITNKRAWSAYLRRTVVRLPEGDFRLIAETCDQTSREMTCE